jgi:hypothetical protein
MFENSVQKRIFGLKRDEETGMQKTTQVGTT